MIIGTYGVNDCVVVFDGTDLEAGYEPTECIVDIIKTSGYEEATDLIVDIHNQGLQTEWGFERWIETRDYLK